LHAAISLLVVVATLGLILTRPRGFAESWAAAGGAVAMVLAGVVGVSDLTAMMRELADVLLFLLGMMVVTSLAEAAGVFGRIAAWCLRLARGSGWLLFSNIFLFGALVTIFLSLDVTVIVLTPIVFAFTTRQRLDALPFMFACSFVANTASLALPISNLTNLLVANQLKLGFGSFAAQMWLPTVAALAVNLGLFLWLFRHQVPRRFEMIGPDTLAPADWWLLVAATVLGATLLAIVGAGVANRPLSWPALAGATVLLLVGLVSGRARARTIASEVSWPLFLFVVGMFLVVRGFEQAWLEGVVVRLPDRPGTALLVGVVGGTVGSNIVNNVPMTVLALTLLPRADEAAQAPLAYGTLIGANIGPMLTTYGSLATMLWLTLVRKRGLDVSTREYMKIGLITVPPVLVAATIALWVTLP